MAEKNLNPIPIPLPQRWREFRIAYLPVLTFAALVAVIAWMWMRYVQPATIVGEAEAVRANIISILPGTLEELKVDRLQAVTNGQELVVLRVMDEDQIQAEVAAAEADVRLLQARIKLDQTRNLDSFSQLQSEYLLEQFNLELAQINLQQAEAELERAKELLKQSLDTMSKRRDVAFNIACFGTSDDFADRKAPVSVSAESVEQAKKWVEDRVALGDSDIYGLLKVVFEQGPTSASMIVGSDPASPAGVDAKELEQAGGAQDFIIKQVEAWRKAGSKTALDVTGIGLSDTQREFYKKLAKAGGGTYLDG